MGGGESGGEGGGSTLSFFLPILLLIVVFYFLVLRPQQRKEKERRAMIEAVKKGDKVITAGGLRGTVVKVYEQEKFARVELTKGVEVDVALAKIEAVITTETPKHPQQRPVKITGKKKIK
ncbi:MAG: preprotein translocase subunit YajC [Candidatus Coatesbacteria bacterium]|nr:MAG: preprotein translocase subunit YajC [Candidatus Coatesbacteria bacterium]